LLESHKEVSAALTAAPYYRASGRLRARVEGRLAVRRVAPWLALTAAVFFAAFIVWRVAPVPQSVAAEVVQAHLRSQLANHLLDVRAAGHSVKPWLAGKLDFPLKVDDLSGRGFILEGGRIDRVNGRTVAALVYRRGPHVVNVFLWPAQREPDRAPTGRVIGGFNLVDWRADGLDWWAISDLSLPELEELPLCPCFMPVHETLRG
jgi:anti-sigma factor RsiW